MTPLQGRIEADFGSETGYRNPGTPEVEGDDGIIPGWDTPKGLFLGDS